MTDLWIDLATRIAAAERDHRDRADRAWRDSGKDDFSLISAHRLRGIADGLEMARELQLQLSAETRGDACPKCGGWLSRCDCGKPAQCGEAWCADCAPEPKDEIGA